MSRHKSVLQDFIEGMLHAREALGGIVVLVVDMDIMVPYRRLNLGAEQIVVDKRLGGLARELHHHARRGIGVHVGILAGDVVVLSLNDFQKDVAGLGAPGDRTLVTVGNVTFSNILTGGFHEFDLDAVLYLLDGHAFAAVDAYAVGNFLDESFILAHIGLEHCLADRRLDFLLIVTHAPAVALFDYLYHFGLSFDFKKYRFRF